MSEERLQRLEGELLKWKRLALAQLVFVVTIGTVAAAQQMDWQTDVTTGALAVIDEEDANLIQARAIAGMDPLVPETLTGWGFTREGLSFRTKGGLLRISEGPDGAPQILLADASGQARLVLGSMTLSEPGNVGGAKVLPLSSVVFIDRSGVAFRTLP